LRRRVRICVLACAACLTISLNNILDAGEQRRSQAESSDADKGSPVRDELLAKLVLALESRLKKSKLALIQIFVVMLSTETEAAAIISTLQEMKFGMETICNGIEMPGKEVRSEATRNSSDFANAQMPEKQTKRRESQAQA
jgi:hypothetical protein